MKVNFKKVFIQKTKSKWLFFIKKIFDHNDIESSYQSFILSLAGSKFNKTRN